MNRKFGPLLLILFMVCGAASTLSYGLKQRSENIRVLEEGTHTSGTVLRTKDKSGIEVTNYSVIYTFTTNDGQIFNGSKDIDYSLYKTFKHGDLMTIVYDPVNPKSNFVVELGVAPLWATISYYAIFLGPGFGLLAFLAVVLVEFGVMKVKGRLGMRNTRNSI